MDLHWSDGKANNFKLILLLLQAKLGNVCSMNVIMSILCYHLVKSVDVALKPFWLCRKHFVSIGWVWKIKRWVGVLELNPVKPQIVVPFEFKRGHRYMMPPNWACRLERLLPWLFSLLNNYVLKCLISIWKWLVKTVILLTKSKMSKVHHCKSPLYSLVKGIIT